MSGVNLCKFALQDITDYVCTLSLFVVFISLSLSWSDLVLVTPGLSFYWYPPPRKTKPSGERSLAQSIEHASGPVFSLILAPSLTPIQRAMPSVMIIGAGVFGLSIAHALPLAYDVTILARDMPGDADSQDWASPWCALPPHVPYVQAHERRVYARPGQAPGLDLGRRKILSSKRS